MDKYCIYCGAELTNGVCPNCSQNQQIMYSQNEMEYYNQYSQQSIDNYAETQNPSKGLSNY